MGRVEVSRPYYLCPHCHNGQFPADVALDVENSEASPGVRRMLATVGQEAPLCVEYDVAFKGCESPMDRNDRNHPSRQGCPSRGGI